MLSAEESATPFARVYQGGKGRLVPVRMTAKITDGRGKVVSNQELVLEPEQFGALRAADYRIALPLAHLTTGEYLLEVEAKSGAPPVRRTIRFAMR